MSCKFGGSVKTLFFSLSEDSETSKMFFLQDDDLKTVLFFFPFAGLNYWNEFTLICFCLETVNFSGISVSDISSSFVLEPSLFWNANNMAPTRLQYDESWTHFYETPPRIRLFTSKWERLLWQTETHRSKKRSNRTDQPGCICNVLLAVRFFA